MRTAVDSLGELSERVREAATELLNDHSVLQKRDMHSGPVFIMSVDGDHHWGSLDPEGQRLQSHALDLFKRFDTLLCALLPTLPDDAEEDLDDSRKEILACVRQDTATFHRRPADAAAAVHESLEVMLRVLADRCSPSNEVVFVPDTNALIANPDLETWEFGSQRPFSLILVPQVLAELDNLKLNHRNENVRTKAESLIRRIKEYRRRGSLSEGVPLVKGTSTIACVAVEPRVREVLPWLDPASPDDRIVASVIEIMRSRPNALVALVTGDVNAQNKSELAGVPYVEPPVFSR